MAPIVTTARIVCKSKEAREKVFAAFHKIVEYSRANEPGVHRYIVTVPVSDTTDTELYMIEEYASKEASDAHIATTPVQDLISLFTTGDVLASAPEVFNSTVVADKVARPPPTVSSNPAIILANFEYKPGTLEHALEGWKDVVEYVTKNEEGTKGYTVMTLDGGNEVRTVEVYDSFEYVENVHLKNPAIKANQDQYGGDRTGVKGAVRVRAVDGFLGREKGAKI